MTQLTLKDVMPWEFSQSYHKSEGFKYVDVVVTEQHFGSSGKWPGTHKNVTYWVELENGYAVGWNRNKSKGWSFPVYKMKS